MMRPLWRGFISRASRCRYKNTPFEFARVHALPVSKVHDRGTAG